MPGVVTNPNDERLRQRGISLHGCWQTENRRMRPPKRTPRGLRRRRLPTAPAWRSDISDKIVRSQEKWHELLSFLDERTHSRWIFRGQSSESWDLRPSAGRGRRYDPLFEERVFQEGRAVAYVLRHYWLRRSFALCQSRPINASQAAYEGSIPFARSSLKNLDEIRTSDIFGKATLSSRGDSVQRLYKSSADQWRTVAAALM